MHPLLPLAQHPRLLSLMPLCGKQMMTIFLLLVPVTIFLFCHRPSEKSFICLSVVCLFWLMNFLQGTGSRDLPPWLPSIAPLPLVFSVSSNLTAQMSKAASVFKEVIEKNKKIELIVLPESSFYSNHLTMPELTEQWDAHNLSRPVHIMAGAFRWDNDLYYNSLHWIYDGKLQQCFNKRHAMILMERVPSRFNWDSIRNLYFKNFPELTASTKKRPQLTIRENFSVVPYICSELFFKEYPDDEYTEVPILAISNDRRFTTYVSKLMYLNARFKAIQWQRPIIYVSFFYQVYVDMHGNVMPIQNA
jgi:apolipoprotein N-acyltransferase